jgi:hexosaminidase
MVTLCTPFGDQVIRYSIDGSEPTERSAVYTGPFQIDRTALVRARAYVGNTAYSEVEKYVMVHKGVGRLLKLNSQYSRYSPAYAAGGDTALVDGLRGSDSFDDCRWQGYQGQDLNIEIDLGSPTDVKGVTVGCLQNSYSWILMPERIQAWVSGDAKTYTFAGEIVNTINARQDGTVLHDYLIEFKGPKTRYLKVVAKNPGKLPSWHHSAGNDSFIFFDEIIVE